MEHKKLAPSNKQSMIFFQSDKDMKALISTQENKIMIASGVAIIATLITPLGVGGLIFLFEVIRQVYLKKQLEEQQARKDEIGSASKSASHATI